MTANDHKPVPELEIRVSPNWVRLVRWCQVNMPHGQLCIRITNGEPTDLIPEHTKRRIRFDKEDSLPIEFNQF